MSEEPQEIKIPISEPPEFDPRPVPPTEYLGPVSPAHTEAAKRLLETEISGDNVVTDETQRQIANALFQAESKGGARIGPLVAELDELKYDPITKLMMRGPGERQAMELFGELKQLQAEGGPTAILCVMIDVKGLHDYNQEHGHKMGDLYISGAAKKLEEVGSQLEQIFRTHEDPRKSMDGPVNEDQRQGDRRTAKSRDILWRRGGDEFVAIIPFRESETVNIDLVKEVVGERLNQSEGTPIRYGMSIYKPDGQSDITPKQVLDKLEVEAEPKAKGESSRQTKAA